MEIECKKCGSLNDYHVIEKTNNKVAYCNKCESYIKNIPHDVPKLYVGKYKGIPISDIEDVNYLIWAAETLHLTSHIKMAVLSQISRLEHLYK